MSYRAQDWAILQQAGDPTAKAVLIALAWSLNTKDGLCCPSLATLAKLSDVKQRHTVLDAVVRLEKAGLIRRTMAKAKNGYGKKTYYTFPGLATWDGVTSEVTPVTSEVTTTVTPQVTPPVTSKVTPVTSEVMGCYLKGNLTGKITRKRTGEKYVQHKFFLTKKLHGPSRTYVRRSTPSCEMQSIVILTTLIRPMRHPRRWSFSTPNPCPLAARKQRLAR